MDIQWDKKYSVGNDRIDHEHQVFLDLIMNASQSDEENASKEKIARLLTEVKKYADFHFFSEENIMIDSGYPEYESHRKEHQILLSRLDETLYRYRIDSIEIGEVVQFMFEWFAMHTTTVDQELGRYLRGE